LFLLGYFGSAGADINGDGTTNVDDMLILIGNFGPCPCDDTCNPDCDGYVPCDPACDDYDFCACEGWIANIPDPNPCSEGNMPDCFGNCCPISWVGDTYCDDGTYSWGGIPIYLNCAEFCYDDGDCAPCDPCDPSCGDYDQCNPDCPDYDPCACGGGDPCECGWGDPCECGWGDPCECGWGDPCECWGDCG
jgi:hypothetical protein